MTSLQGVQAIPPVWRVDEPRFQLGFLPHYESIFTLANGYMGVRGSLETNLELGDPGFYLCGVYDRVHDFVHEIVNLPCWLGLGLQANGFELDLRKGCLLSYRRTLDLRHGILWTRLLWRDAGHQTTRLHIARLVHKTEPHIALQWGWVTPLNYSARIVLTSDLDGWRIRDRSPSREARLTAYTTRDLASDGIFLACSTRASRIRVALATHLAVEGAESRRVFADDDRIREHVMVPAARGQPIPFVKVICVYSSLDTPSPDKRVLEELRRSRSRPLRQIVTAHTRGWAQTWSLADVRVGGDAEAQKALRFNVFHLCSLAAVREGGTPIGAKGLHGNGYAGQVFWDTEVYLLPFYIHTHPEVARSILLYRYRTLPDARWNARQRRCRGAFYPWNSSLTARERPWHGWQEHVGSDIAYGVEMYVRATQDEEFLRNAGAELILETARYWADRVEWDEGRRAYVLRTLTGPDEIHAGVDNNAFTNGLVKWHLALAFILGRRLLESRERSLTRRLALRTSELRRWEEISHRMYEPFDPQHGFHEQFDGYFRLPEGILHRTWSRMRYTGPVQHSYRSTRVAQQADTVLLYWMFPNRYDEAIQRPAYWFYERRCSHTSSLSRPVYAALAARLGLRKEAYRQFLRAAENDLAPGHEIESENGIHAAGMGGTWIAAVLGFGGLKVQADALVIRPRLPVHWRRLAFAVRYRGCTVEIQESPDEVRVRTRGGTVPIQIGDVHREVGSQGYRFRLQTARPRHPDRPRRAGP